MTDWLKNKIGKGVVIIATLGLMTTAASALPIVPTLVVGAGGSLSAIEDFGDSGTNFDFDEQALGYKVFAGIESNLGLPGVDPKLGFEVQYSDLGTFDLANGQGELHGTTVGLSGRASVELANFLTLSGKAGMHFWNSDGEGPAAALSNAFDENDGTDFFFGLGTEFKIIPNVSIRAEWERFQFGDADLDVGTLSVVFKLF
ncbi:MAG: outer membrane beta-barrel protein [Alphaproteobacteria bacterium]